MTQTIDTGEPQVPAQEAELRLSAVIEAVLSETDEVNPRDIAALVLDRLPPESYQEALLDALGTAVRLQLSARRSTAYGKAVTAQTHSARTAPPRAAASPDGDAQPEHPAADSRPGWAVRAVQQHAELLRSRVFTATGWKMLGECTLSDVSYLANERTVQAEIIQRAADRYAKLAEKMAEHGVDRVADLDPSVWLVVG